MTAQSIGKLEITTRKSNVFVHSSLRLVVGVEISVTVKTKLKQFAFKIAFYVRIFIHVILYGF